MAKCSIFSYQLMLSLLLHQLPIFANLYGSRQQLLADAITIQCFTAQPFYWINGGDDTLCSSIGSCWATQLNLSQLFWWSCICIWPGIVVRAADLQAAVLGSIPACQYVICNMIICNYVICILDLTKLRSTLTNWKILCFIGNCQTCESCILKKYHHKTMNPIKIKSRAIFHGK